nr:hypothetical protein [Tanacetum cinerariifolium]
MQCDEVACMQFGSDLRPPIRASTSLKILFEQEDAGREQEHSKQSEKKPRRFNLLHSLFYCGMTKTYSS